MIFGILETTTRIHPNRGESRMRLATELKYLKDARNDPGNAPHRVAGAKLISNLLDIHSAHGNVERATANERRHGHCRKIME